MRREGCQCKLESENCSPDNIRLEKDQNVSLGDTWVPTGSTVLRQPRETENKLQMWDSNPAQSKSRSWPNEECEQTVDLRVNDIPNDEIYKDKQYMLRIAEQVQKLVNTERFF